MELSAHVTDGLHILGDTAHIPDNLFSVVVERTCECLVKQEKTDCFQGCDQLSGLDQAVLKHAHGTLVTLLLECAKHDKDVTSLEHILEDIKFSAERTATFGKIYSHYKQDLRLLLSCTGNNPPHIVDVDWRLDYYIKDNHVEKVNQPTYMVSLKTEECGSDGTKDIEFACTQEQLQDLVGKLKDACKSLERVSQM